jgi:hypothetical protein
MSEDRLHIMLGNGKAANALAAYLARHGIAVRALSRHRPPRWPVGHNLPQEALGPALRRSPTSTAFSPSKTEEPSHD